MTLASISPEDVKRIAVRADAARRARDAAARINPGDIAEPPPVRGEREPTAPLGFDPLPDDDPDLAALRREIAELPEEARSELRAVAWIGDGDYAAAEWAEALAAADDEPDAATRGALEDDIDLHHRLMKGLYELGEA